MEIEEEGENEAHTTASEGAQDQERRNVTNRFNSRRQIVELEQRMVGLEDLVDSFRSHAQSEIYLLDSVQGNLLVTLERQLLDAKIKLAKLEADLQAAQGSGRVVALSRVKPKEPESYEGTRESKVLENYLYDTEQFFVSAKITTDAKKVFHASMFLVKDAKLWWRNYLDDVVSNCNTFTVQTWGDFKTAIQKRFLPLNTEWKARQAVDNLKHTEIVREYIKTHRALMLEIKHMSDEDRFFGFMNRLKGWAHVMSSTYQMW